MTLLPIAMKLLYQQFLYIDVSMITQLRFFGPCWTDKRAGIQLLQTVYLYPVDSGVLSRLRKRTKSCME